MLGSGSRSAGSQWNFPFIQVSMIHRNQQSLCPVPSFYIKSRKYYDYWEKASFGLCWPWSKPSSLNTFWLILLKFYLRKWYPPLSGISCRQENLRFLSFPQIADKAGKSVRGIFGERGWWSYMGYPHYEFLRSLKEPSSGFPRGGDEGLWKPFALGARNRRVHFL